MHDKLVGDIIVDMMNNKRSFFERLTGTVRLDEDGEVLDGRVESAVPTKVSVFGENDEEVQLTVDVYQTSTEIIIKTMVAGVRPEDLDVSISRDVVTIRGERKEERNVSDDEYFHRELYWGAFTRTINLPEEIDVDGSEATEKHGMLILRLPKLDKNRQTKLKVRG